MQYRTMKKNGDQLSILGFGCMRLPQSGNRIDEPRATAQLRSAIDRGVNYIDTAMPYHMGASEPFLGRALTDGYRERIKLATKLPYWNVKRHEDMDLLLNAQLDSLKTDRIDYYLIHNLDGAGWDAMRELGIVNFLNRNKKEGRIVNAGFSFHSRLAEFRAIIDSHDWDFCQIQYNYLDEHNQAGTEGLEYAAAKRLGIIIMEPLRGGNLAGPLPPAITDIFDAAPVKRSAVEWSLRWIWNHPEVTVVLSGMNDEGHIDENLRIASEAEPDSLTAAELDIIARVEKKFREIMPVGCTGCRYCMPCPSGVDIPTCFEIYNTRSMWGNRKETLIQYMARLSSVLGKDQAAYASMCRACGKCEKACPQALPIQAHLKNVAKEFEGPMLTTLNWIGGKILNRQRKKALRRGERKRGEGTH